MLETIIDMKIIQGHDMTIILIHPTNMTFNCGLLHLTCTLCGCIVVIDKMLIKKSDKLVDIQSPFDRAF